MIIRELCGASPSPSHVSGKITWLSERLPRAMGNGGSLALWAGVLDLMLLCGLSNCLNVFLGVPLFLFVIVPKISIVSSKFLPQTVGGFFCFMELFPAERQVMDSLAYGLDYIACGINFNTLQLC